MRALIGGLLGGVLAVTLLAGGLVAFREARGGGAASDRRATLERQLAEYDDWWHAPQQQNFMLYAPRTYERDRERFFADRPLLDDYRRFVTAQRGQGLFAGEYARLLPPDRLRDPATIDRFLATRDD